MLRIFFLFSLSLSFLLAAGQDRGVVTGRAFDSVRHIPLEGATVTVSRQGDSGRIATFISKADGSFRLSGIPLHDSLLIQISFTGYETFKELIFLQDRRLMMQTSLLHPASQLLKEVIVESKRGLMVIKGDTVEFNARNFKLAPNAMAEDLIRRIPGLTVDKNGKLFFNGRQLNTILVDGREFFSSEGGVALSNIPFELIDKIQIADTKTKVEKLLHQQAAGNGQTMNIKLKNGNNYFGNLAANAGTDNRYQGDGLVSATIDKDRFSILLGANNTNTNIGESRASNLAMVTGGVAKAISGTLDYSKAIQNGTIHTSYQFDQPIITHETTQRMQQNILPDSTLRNASTSSSWNKTTGHTLSLNIDRNKGLSFFTSLEEKLVDNTSQTNLTTTGQQGSLLNSLSGNYRSQGDGLNWTNRIDFQKTLGPTGGSFGLQVAFNYSRQNNHDLNLNATGFYRNGNPDSVSNTRQHVDGEMQGKNFIVSAWFSKHLSKFVQIRLFNYFSVAENQSGRTAWQLDTNNIKKSIDVAYSNSFRSNLLSDRASVFMNYNKNRWNIEIGATLLDQYQQQKDLSRNKEVVTRLLRFSPITTFTYKSARHDDLKLNISNEYENPTLEQLQPVPDNSNPLSIKSGNPGLKPATSYTTSLMYSKLIPGRHDVSLSATTGFGPVLNKIVAATTFDSLGRQTIQYRNVNGTYAISQQLGGAISFRHGDNALVLQSGSGLAYARDKQYVNGTLSDMCSFSFSPEMEIDYSSGANIYMVLSWAPVFNQVQYKPNNAPGTNYTVNQVIGILNWFLLKRFKWNNRVAYRFNNDVPAPLAKSSLTWNMDLSYLCLKDKKGEIKLTVFDLLKQNRNVWHSVTPSVITDSQSNGLQQYFLIGFAYHFNKLSAGR